MHWLEAQQRRFTRIPSLDLIEKLEETSREHWLNGNESLVIRGLESQNSKQHENIMLAFESKNWPYVKFVFFWLFEFPANFSQTFFECPMSSPYTNPNKPKHNPPCFNCESLAQETIHCSVPSVDRAQQIGYYVGEESNQIDLHQVVLGYFF